MLAFSSLSPSETVCTVAWRGRLAQEEGGGVGGGGLTLKKKKSPSKVTLNHMCEFRHTLFSRIKLEKVLMNTQMHTLVNVLHLL